MSEKASIEETHQIPPVGDVLDLLQEQTSVYLDWSWEGTMGYEEKIESIGKSFGYENTHVIVNAQSAIIEIDGQHRIAKCGIPDIPPLASLPKVKSWYHNILKGSLSPSEAKKELKEIRQAPAVYSSFLRWLGVVLLAIGFSVDVVGTWEGVAMAAITAIPVGIVLLATGWIKGFNKIGGLVATFASGIIAMLAWKYGFTHAAPGLLLISATFVFIPGDSISTQALEMAEGRWSPAVDRLFYSIMILVLQVAGVILAAIVTQTPMAEILPTSVQTDFAWWFIYPASLVFLLGNMLAFQMRLSDYIPALLILLLARASAQLGTIAYGEYVGSFLGMFLATVAAIWYDQRSENNSPAFVFLLTPLFALSPGSHGLRALQSWVSGNEITGVNNLSTLGSVLLSIAIGALLGSMLMKGLKKKKLVHL